MKKLFIIFFLLLSVLGYTQTVTPVLYPQYMEGVGNGVVADLRSVPYACRMNLSGLIPNRLYYYYNRFVLDPSNANPDPNGQGTIIVPQSGVTPFQRITAPNLSAASTAGTFTTDANGSYTGWFITEPTASPVYFPGNQVYWRIMLRNDQFAPANAVELRLTASLPVRTLQWLNYAPSGPTPPTGFVGTLVTRAATATDFTPKNFVMLYDNVAGTGRPIGGTFVEDDLLSVTGLGYIASYPNGTGAAQNGRWGAIIPSGSPQGPGLANGIRNISQFSYSNGSLVNVCNGNSLGTFGTVNTVNHVGTQASGGGTLNITTCGTAVVSCNNLSLSTVVTGTACNANTGAVDLTVSGGTAPYTYLWSNGATTEDISGLPGGNYNVTVTDATNVCTSVSAATVGTTQLISLSAVITGASACVNNSGAIDLSVNGGVGPYTYSWSNGATTEDLTGLNAGTYTVTVTGAGTCTATASYIVSQPAALSATASAPAIPNCGTTTTVLVSATGGTPPYTGTGSFSVTAGTYNYTVTDARGCSSSTSITIAPATCINAAEVIYPKFVQGVGSGSPSSDLKVPYAARMTLSGLNPNATYRFFTSFTNNPGSNNNGAAGAMILANQTGDFTRITSTSVGTAGEYGEFTTDASGSYTGWYVLEPGSDIIYTPGNSLYWRIMLNDGAGGTLITSRVTATNPVTVINWGFTSGAALEGSAIYNVANTAWAPKNFVMLYDNIGGTGRPVSGTFIESDGTVNTTVEGYDLWYEFNVNGFDNVWGTIIPNNLANGINNISQYALSDGSFVNKCTSPDGVYGTTDTRNASAGNDAFGTLLVIDCTPTAGCSLAGTTTVTNVLCFGASTGAVDLTVTGGTAPTYLWSNGATTEDLVNVPAGTYTATITDGSCTATASATVTQPLTNLSASASATNATCGIANGSINLTVTGGTPVYSYLWSNGATTEDISGLAAGTYSVTVTDANGCTTTASATVNNAGAPAASAVATNATCGNANGSINLTVTGGTAPYSYLWSNGATTEDISGLAAGSYSVTVTDANGCIASASATVNNIAGPSASAVASNTTCGNANGSINLTVTGGTAPYSYLWSNGATTEDLSGLAAGSYSVTVTDANGCIASASATVNNIAGPSASAVATNATCGASNGSINLTVTGGTAPYSYLWSNGATTEDISGLAAGSYSVTVTDANGCIASASATVNNIAGPSASAVATNATCGASNGSINLTVTGGTAPYSYLWSNGATTEDLSGLAAGSYSVTVTDANGCIASASATVNNVAGPSASAVASNATCGNANGSINLTVTGGTAPYSYLWSNGATTEDLSGLAAGSYSVTVTDANGCIASASATVNNIAGPSVAVTSTTNVLCFGQSTGSINITVTGGNAPYSYLWSNGATTEDISGLAAGSYSVTVTDANGCIASVSATITQPTAALAASAIATSSTCSGENGSINLTVTGGTAPYSYLWSNGATTEDLSNLTEGSYSVTVTDANGCIASASATVNNVAGPSASAVASNATCGNANGSINLTVTGGTAPYSYLWSNGATTEDISGLAAGSYSVTVTDANGCIASASATVNNIAGPSASAVASNATCGASNGSINLTVTGGTAPYSYLWSNGATTEDISGLAAGSYSVTVTDANGCIASASATVNNIAGPSASAVATNATCGASNGSINLTVTGGTAPYSYLWSNGATTEDLSGLAAGSYSVTVTDANGCIASASATVNNIAGPSASAVATNATCGASNGSINLTVTGGTAPYSYLWSNGATTEDLSGLAAGSYSVTVTDANGCIASASATVNNVGAPSVVVTSTTNVLCFGQSTGSINITVTGGTAPYSYLWSNGATTEDLSGLPAGTYSVTVTDANGCSAGVSATITQPTAALAASAVATNATCGNANGSINLTVTGGTAPYSYLWSNGATTEDISGLAAGSYSVTVTDANGCIASASATVNNIAGPSASAVASNATCGNANGSINLTVTGGTAPYSYLWSNGATTEDLSGLAGGSYSVTVTDANGCIASASATVNNIAGPSASAVASNATCGASNGSINLTVTGGTAPYSYLWSNGATTEDLSGLAAGSYSVTVTDANGCIASASATVNNVGGPSVVVTSTTNVSCFGQSTGSINITVTGGNAPYSYLWSNGATTEDLSGLAAGSYSVTVTDANGCSAGVSATITQPTAALAASAIASNATCGNANGSINLTVTGGTAPYSYLWSNGATTEDLSGLAAGSYSVTVTDANGCIASASATVNNVAGPSASAVASNATCGNANGSINLTVTGGTAPYSYLWSNGATTEDLSGLAAGSYSVTVTDANGCIASASATVNNVAGPSASAVASNATCGNANGSINLTVTGGTAPYSYLWSNGATTEDLSGLAAGSYSVTVTDANGCIASASATVNNIAGPSASAVATNATCGNANGSINLTVTGGTAPYSYLWSNGATTEDLSGLAAGSYSVTVTDANGCIASASATVNNVAGPSASAVASNATCGNANGSINLTVTGGTAPYSYLWSNGATTEDISGLAAGSYSVTVTDANGCIASASATVNNIAGPSASAVASNATCGNANGSINLTVTGGTAPYSYLWSNGATTEDLSGLAAGSYSVTVTDANGCIASASATVNNIAGPSASAVATNATCGAANGSIDLTVTGGTAPYSYLWSNGATTEDLSGLAAGSYSVTVTDANGCIASASATVNNVGAPAVVVTSTTNVLCFGQSTGSINITVTGGSAPYSFLWSNGATTEDISGLAAGSYSVTVTDANGCSASVSATISQPASAITASAVGVGLTCSTTGNNGTVTLTVGGGTAPYTYLWSNGATTQNLAALAAGTYSVTVTDSKGCTASASAIIRPRFAAGSSVGTLACNAITGQVTVTATGGTGPYVATATTAGISPASASGAGPFVFTVPFGAYSFTVTDASGCSRTVTGRVAGPLVAAASAGTIACGATTTIVTVSASQGIPPYSGTGNFTVGAGPYSFTVTDSRGCTATISGTIAAPLCYTVAEVFYPKYVQGVGSGSPSADTKVPYAARMTIGGLTAGATYRYFSRFVDNPSSALSNGIGDFILVNQVGNFSRVTSASMNTAGEYGEFTADGSGNYSGWFIQEPGSDIGFTPGNQLYWRIMLNDGAGGNTVAARVTASSSVTVLNFGSTPSEGTGLRRTASPDYTAKNFVMLYDNVAGSGRPEAGTFIESDGTDNSLANGYAAFYDNSVNGVDKTWGTIIPNNLSNGINNISQYALSNGSFVNACTSPDGVFGGTTDTKNANGGLTELVITDCAAPCNVVLSFTQTNVSCFGGSTGSATVTAVNTTGVVSYLWSNGQTTATATGLAAGTYSVTVTDANECSATGSVTITQPTAALASSAVASNATCGNANGSINLTVTGGTAPYSYLWSNGATTEDISGLAAGSYSVTVTDANGCIASASATVNNIAGPSASAVASNATCGNANGSINLTVTGGTAPYSYLWSNGATTEDLSGLAAGSYSVTVTDANGCIASASATVNNIAGPSASAVATNATCGAANGSIDLTVTGGTAPYSYLWSNGATTEDLSGLAAGSYSVTVTDANGCIASASATVNNVGAPAVVVTSTTNVLCFGQSTGSINITVTGGSAPYSFLWSNGATTEDISGLAAGSYSVTVTDANGCSASVSATISQPASAITASAVGVGLTCSTTGNNGTVTLTVGGGTAPYTYLWSNGATTQNLAALAAGTYSVTVTDSKGCTASASAIIRPRFAAGSSVGTLACNAITGQVTVTATGGTGPYVATATTAGISPASASGAGPFVFTVPFGAYSFTVTDASGCSRTVTGRVAGPLVAAASAGTIACGATTTIVTVSASQGIPPYSGTGNFTVGAGPYSFTVTDSRGCTATISGTIAAPLCYTVAEVFYPKYVQGVGSGSPSADTKVPYAARMTIGGLTAGATYRYFSRFVDNPSSALSNGIGDFILVNQVGNFSRVTSASMNTAGEYGEFTADGSGNYSGWFIQEPGSDIGFTPGNQLYWRIMLNDGAGGNTVAARVTASSSVTVLNFGSTPSEGTGLRRTASPDYTAKNFVMLYDNVAGSGRPEAGTFIESDGTDNSLANGYAAFYDNSVNGVDKTWGTIIPNNLSNGINNISQYALSNGSFVSACTSPDGVFGGTTDTKNANGGLTELVITDCAAPCNVVLSFTQTNVSCFGGSTGTATVTAVNTTGVVSYLWSNGQTTATATGLAAGTYSVTVTDANECSATGSVTITQPTAALVATANAGTINCYGELTTVIVSATGGTAPYTGTGSFDRGAGTYSFTVTDANGCTSVATVTITAPDAIVVTATAGTINCNGGTTTVTVSATGGVAPYMGTGTFNVGAGTYTYTVTDANECTASTTITITQPVVLVATSSAPAIACNGGSTTITVAATGGTAPYTGTGTFSRPAGTYSFTVTDANGCTAVTNITVSEPAVLNASSTSGVIACNGGSTTVTVSATGGTAPYTGTGTFTRSAGTYSFTVTDANGCTSVTTITISQPDVLTASSSAGVIACNGGSTTVLVSATGGTAPYTGTGSFTRTAGTYSFTVTDANGCSAVTTITIAQPAVLSVTATSTPANSGNNGTATANAVGGTAPYSYLWTPGGQTTATAVGLAAGVYNVTVTDARGCTATATITVNAGGCNISVTAGPDRNLCSPVTLTAMVSGAVTSGPAPPQPFMEVAGSTSDKRLFSGNIDQLTIGNTFSQSEDRNNCGSNVESSKILTVPTGAVVKKAYLYWSGSGSVDDKVKIQRPGSGSFTLVTAENTKSYSRSGGFNYFAGRADITSLITGSGTYTVKDLNWNNGNPYCYDNSAYGAWAMTVVYEQASLPSARIHINTEKFQFTYPAATYSTTINNISVPAGCNADAELTIVAFEGDNYKGENLRIAGVLDADPNNFRGQAGPNLDIITKNAPSIVGGTTSLTYSIEAYQSGSIFGQAIEGLFDYVKVLKYKNCPPACNSVSYLWSNGATTQSINVTTPGSYNVRVTDCNGCIARDTVNVTACPPVDPNKCYKLIARHSGKVLSVTGSSLADAANIEQRSYTGANNQIWKFAEVQPGFYSITNVNSNKVAEVANGSSSDGANVRQNTYSNVDYRKWSLTSTGNGYYAIKAKHSNKTMSVAGSSNSEGANVEQRGTGSNSNQQWRIIEVSCALPFTYVKEEQEEIKPDLSVSVMPNPGITHFNLSFSSTDNTTPLNVRILDINGREISMHPKVGVKSVLRIGIERWTGGIYFAEVSQGGLRKVVRLVKAN